MALEHEFLIGDAVVFHASEKPLEEARKVVVQVLHKQGTKIVKLAITAPPEIHIAFVSSDSVIFAGEGV